MSVPLCALRCLGTLLAVVALAAPAHAAAPDVTDEIAAGWRTDRLYVYDALRPGFPRAELDRIRAAARALEVPVYVALLPESTYTRRNSLDLPTLLHARIGGDGLFLVWVGDSGYWRGTAELVVGGRERGDELLDVRLDDGQDNRIRTDTPAPRIVRVIQQAGTAIDGRPLPGVAVEDLDESALSPDGLSVTDKKNLSAYIGMGLGALTGFVLVLRYRRRLRGPGKPAVPGASAPVRVPMSVRSVRKLASDRMTGAERALRKLEARISAARSDRAELPLLLDQRDEASRRLEAARLLLAHADRDPGDGLTAAAGAFVLGRQAHQAASGSAVEPPCFFNPLHTAGSRRIDRADIDVPSCGACLRMVRGDGRPDTFRVWRPGTLGAGRTAVDYWEADPADDLLTSTGFGALDDDLPGRIIARYGDRR